MRSTNAGSGTNVNAPLILPSCTPPEQVIVPASARILASTCAPSCCRSASEKPENALSCSCVCVEEQFPLSSHPLRSRRRSASVPFELAVMLHGPVSGRSFSSAQRKKQVKAARNTERITPPVFVISPPCPHPPTRQRSGVAPVSRLIAN